MIVKSVLSICICAYNTHSHLKEEIDCSPKSKNLMYWLKVAVGEISSHLQ